MLEVLHALKQSDQVFYVSVSILDLYFKKSGEKLKVSDLHLTGIACMFLASKVEEVLPIQMSEMIEDVGHFNFTKEEIQKQEIKVLSTL